MQGALGQAAFEGDGPALLVPCLLSFTGWLSSVYLSYFRETHGVV